MLIGCEKCGGEICETARRCPHCGVRRRPTKRPPKRGGLAAWLLYRQTEIERTEDEHEGRE
jgi:uncharacterized OB-fold protein